LQFLAIKSTHCRIILSISVPNSPSLHVPCPARENYTARFRAFKEISFFLRIARAGRHEFRGRRGDPVFRRVPGRGNRSVDQR